MFRSPGNGMGDKSMAAEAHFQDNHLPPIDNLNDSQYSDAHLEDIKAQHSSQFIGNRSHHESAALPKRGNSTASSPSMDKNRGHQATPVGDDPQTDSDNEL